MVKGAVLVLGVLLALIFLIVKDLLRNTDLAGFLWDSLIEIVMDLESKIQDLIWWLDREIRNR